MIEDAKDRASSSQSWVWEIIGQLLLLGFASLAVRSKKSGGASSDEGLEGTEP